MKKRIMFPITFIIMSSLIYMTGCGKLQATTMRLLHYSGNVTLEESGKDAEVKEDRRLFSGDVLSTGNSSRASVGLDDVKVVSLDQNSCAEFEQDGKKLQLDLTSGKLFFEVSKPLEEDESFDIRTSTMIVGIRGTSGIVEVDQNGDECVTVTDGTVSVKAVNPSNGEEIIVDVKAGEKLTIRVNSSTNSIEYEITNIFGGELPGFAKEIITADSVLLEKILADTGWRDLSQLPEPEGAEDANETEAGDTEEASSDSMTPDTDELYKQLTELFDADDAMGLKDFVVDQPTDNAVLKQMFIDIPADPLNGGSPYPEIDSPEFYSKIYVLNGSLSDLKNGDIIIYLQRIINLAGHFSDSITVMQVLDNTAFSLFETNETDDGSTYRDVNVSSPSAYKEFQVYDLSMSAFLTEKYYYRYASGGNYTVYDFDTDEVYHTGATEETAYIQY